MESAAKRKSLAHDASAIMCIIEMVILYSEDGPHSIEMSWKVMEDYKGKLATLDEDYKKRLSSKDEELQKKDGKLAANAETIDKKDADLLN